MEKELTLQGIIADAVSDFKDRIENYASEFYEGEPHDVIHEIADSSVPVYTVSLLGLAHDNLELATAEPELGPAFDGKPTPVNIIAANVFEAIEQALWDYWNDHEEEIKEAWNKTEVPDQSGLHKL